MELVCTKGESNERTDTICVNTLLAEYVLNRRTTVQECKARQRKQ